MKISGLLSLFLVFLIGCKPAPMKNIVVAKADSPDGKSSAVLVERNYQAARLPDEFFLVIIPSDGNIREAINERHIGNSSALVAIWAGRVKLEWQTTNTLLVVCNACELKPIDISKKLDRLGAVRIVYQGFPAGTADSST